MTDQAKAAAKPTPEAKAKALARAKARAEAKAVAKANALRRAKALAEARAMTPGDVKDARESLGLTQAELADALELEGVYGKDSVRNWERGKRPISGPARVALRLMVEAARAKGSKAPAFGKADKSTLLLALDLAAKAASDGAAKLRLVGSPSDKEADAASERFRQLRAKLDES